MMKNEAQVDKALAELNAAADEHAALVSTKCRALGVTVGSVGAMALDRDPEVLAAYDRLVKADRAYVVACGE
jgi:hypothetical protein